MLALERGDWNLRRAMSEWECRVLSVALERTHGNQTEAARLLGISARSIYNKIKKHRLHK